MKFCGLFIVCIFLITKGFGQSQLVLLKGERVILRLLPGDDFVFRLKGSPKTIFTYINNLSDTAVVTHNDTIPFQQIERIYFPHHTFLNKIGTVLVIGGAGYFVIDQLNTVIIRGNDFSLDDRVTRTSVGAVIVGIPLMLIHKKSQKIGYRYRLYNAPKRSPFYLDPGKQGYRSPYIQQN